MALTHPEDVVFDPYLGAGSTVIAAVKQDRQAMGCDVVQDYVDIAWSRIRQFYAGELRTREMGKPIYDPTLPYGGHK